MFFDNSYVSTMSLKVGMDCFWVHSNVVPRMFLHKKNLKSLWYLINQLKNTFPLF